jgi:SAM-dependent methyltransferase
VGGNAVRGVKQDSAPWRPHGRALLDYSDGDTAAEVVVHGDDGETEVVPIRVFFRGPSEFSALEEAAIDLCRGRVLDAGAGAGCHSLILQEHGLSVCAIDIAPEAVEVMRRRGVKDVRCQDLFGFQEEPFDTILLMMNGIGVVGDLAGLDRLLAEVHRLLAPDGQILLDSYDPAWPDDQHAGRSSKRSNPASRYLGEMRFRLEYKGKKGPTLAWLFLDSKLLTERAMKAGWSCEVIWQEEEGHYLARLTRARPETGLGIRRAGARGRAGPGSRSRRAPPGRGPIDAP